MAYHNKLSLPRLIDEKVAEAIHYHDQGRIVIAYCLVKEAEKLLNAVNIEERPFAIDKFKTSSGVCRILQAGEPAIQFLNAMKDKSKWIAASHAKGSQNTCSSTGITVSTHVDEESGKYYFKVEGVLSLDMIYIIAAFMEVDLYPTWMPFCSQSEIIGSHTPYRRLTRTIIDLKCLKREAMVLSLADELPGGDMFLYLNSCCGHPTDRTVPMPLYPRMDIEGGFLFHTMTSPSNPRDCTSTVVINNHLNAHDASIDASAIQSCDWYASAPIYFPEGRLQSVLETPINVKLAPDLKSSKLKHAALRKSYLPSESDLEKEYDCDNTLRVKPQPAVTPSPSLRQKATEGRWFHRVLQNWFTSTDNSGVDSRTPQHHESKEETTFRSSAAAVDSSEGSDYEIFTDMVSSECNRRQSTLSEVKVTACFRIDPQFSFVPDWMLYSVLKSSAYTILTMLDWQAKLFLPGCIHHHRLLNSRYDAAREHTDKKKP